MKDKVILFDDDISNLNLYKSYLSDHYNCISFMNPFEYEKAIENNPEIIILDVMMPLLTGPRVYQKIIQHPHYNGCPILFISASNSDETILGALSEGGQGFLSRSMGQQEILYRIRNQIDYFKANRSVFKLAEVKIDMKSLKAYENESVVDLTLTELKILKELLIKHPKNLTRKEMVDAIWPGLKVQDNTLNTHVSNLRGKFERWSYEIQHIKNHGFHLCLKNN